jgi:lipoyl(octanoyl) transferase
VVTAFSTSTAEIAAGTEAANPTCRVLFLGLTEYQAAWDLQIDLVRQRSAGLIDDTFLLLEHPPVYTLGRLADTTNIVSSPEEIERLGATIVQIDRGGDVTFHGPGQLVGYPIMLIEDRRNLVGYVRRLEEVLIRTLRSFGVETHRIEGLSGVWVNDRKIAAIGVKIGRVTSHGFALNVSTDLSFFGHIVPCGIRDKGVTSMHLELDGCVPELREVADVLIGHFGEVFGRSIQPQTGG